MTDRKNMSIMELANDILSKSNKAMTFADIYHAVCEIKGIGEEEKANMISQVYADFISSAKFIYVGDDEWDSKGRQAIDLWDKDGAYYDEYPDFEEELSQFEDADEDFDLDEVEEEKEDKDEEDEELEDDIKEDIDDKLLEEFKEDLDDEDTMYDDFEKEEEEDYVEDEEDLVYEEETGEDFDDEEYNEYMDDYEKMYDD